MVIDIIQIVKVRTGENTYPPAVVSMLVASIIQMLYCLYYLSRSGRTKVFTASNAAAAIALLMIWQLGKILFSSMMQRKSQWKRNADLNSFGGYYDWFPP